MMGKANRTEICAYSMRRAKIEGESGFSSTSMPPETASDISKGIDGNNRPQGADQWQGTPETWVGKEGAAMTDKNTDQASDSIASELGVALEKAPQKSLQIDVAKYQAMLDAPDLSASQKEQVIKALWQIIACFVDLGYGVSPLQLACGEREENAESSGEEQTDVVGSEATTLTAEFNMHAAE